MANTTTTNLSLQKPIDEHNIDGTNYIEIGRVTIS